ncbi:MAG: glycosyltransferase family 4 protein [Gemmatimonadota bacterium]
MRPRRVLFLTRYGEISAATRYRATQYLPALEAAGFECRVRPLLPDRYLQRSFGQGGGRSALLSVAPEIAGSLLRRWWLLHREVASYDVVHLQYEALPYLPYAFERSLFTGRVPTAVDFDDAVSVAYERHPNPLVRALLAAKIPRIVAGSRHVTVANRTLEEWALRLNPRVSLLPNAIDLRRYPAAERLRPAGEVPVIVWIGTPVTAKYLRLLEDPLRRLRERHPFRLKVIGVPDFRMEGVDVVALPWSEATEVQELETSDIGVMPLPDDEWARGKSALKLLQYMAAGIVAVGSPVGANRDVISDGETGALAADGAEWTEKLAALLADPARRARLAAAGRRVVEERYSLRSNESRFVQILRGLVE